ncbi:MAG: hypothetical protein IPK78_13790 [Rhodospirillales bacterium]|nr:hypothetical protein [Rhodospirillales bacterium]
MSPAAAQDVIDVGEANILAAPTAPLVTEDDRLVLAGLRVFTEETFGGNGRVCASCHPPTNNFTIDPAFIRKLPSNDPLFVSEFDPNLRALERPKLLRQFGLVLVNIDGFDKPGVSRAVPHTLGLSQTIAKGATAFPLANMTGWSGDGSPGDGSLRSFALGAVKQHFPKTLARRECSASAFDPATCDFRVPTDAELDALEKFQLFLGRQGEINIEPFSRKPNEIVFLDPFVEAGKALFHSVRGGNSGGKNFSCSSCHKNAGANDRAGNGRLIAIGANKHSNAPACRLPGIAPGDGGFSRLPLTVVAGSTFCRTTGDFDVAFSGKGQFNTPSLIEAADTPPFFHNNIVKTIEEAVAFYNSAVFALSPTGGGLPFDFSNREVRQIAALLRVLNALDNMNNGDRFDHLAQRTAASQPDLVAEAVEIAASETQDAIQVLTSGPVSLYADKGVVPLLRRALTLERQATASWDPGLLDTAMRLKDQARDLMIEIRL